MQQLMNFQADYPRPRSGKTVPREHYRVEKWEAYPFSEPPYRSWCSCRTTLQTKIRFPRYSRIPGSDQTKEELAGETSPIWTSLPYSSRATTPWLSIMSGRGWAAIVVDNAGTGEEGDVEHAAGRSSHDYPENLARFLLEMDWSWLGYTSYADQCILDWVKTRPWAQKPYYPQRLLPGNGTHDGSGQPEPGYLCLRV